MAITGSKCEQCGFESYRFVKNTGDGYSDYACAGCGAIIHVKDFATIGKSGEIIPLKKPGKAGARNKHAIQLFAKAMEVQLCTSCAKGAGCPRTNVPADYSCFTKREANEVGEKCLHDVTGVGCRVTAKPCPGTCPDDTRHPPRKEKKATPTQTRLFP